MRQTERRRRMMMVVGVLSGTLMLALSGILVGEAFTGTSLHLVGMPASGGPEAREGKPPAVIESKEGAARREVVPRRGDGPRTADPAPTLTPAQPRSTPLSTPLNTQLKTPRPSASREVATDTPPRVVIVTDRPGAVATPLRPRKTRRPHRHRHNWPRTPKPTVTATPTPSVTVNEVPGYEAGQR
ncbi:MAG: hypothetical protein HOY71_00430 [Nonomuraea sp.]|nr:hypothetical protein [Nonomuraea sp.]